jgi:hypothetical protein
VVQSTAGRLEDVGPPSEVDGGSTAVMKEGDVAGLKVGCRPGGTWAEQPLVGPGKDLFFLSSSKRVCHTSSCSMEALTSSFRVQPRNSVRCSRSTGLSP